jgi:hypothetical protein
MGIDKSRAWDALNFCVWLNQHASYFYKVSPGPGGLHGDKSLIHVAWRYIGRQYAMPLARWDASPPGILQKDFAGNVLFVHLVQGKPSIELDSTGHAVFSTTGQRPSFNAALPLADFVAETIDRLRSLAPPEALRPKATVAIAPEAESAPALPLAGDLLKIAISKVGFDRLSEWWTAKTGKLCRCAERQELLNKADMELRKWLGFA